MRRLAATAPINFGAGADDPAPEPERFILSWGDNTYCQCLVSKADHIVPSPRLVPCRRPMKSLAVGWEHSLLIDNAGNLWGGGNNRAHCLSEESPEDCLQFTRLDLADLEGVPFEAVQVGREHMIAVLEGGRAVISWGTSNEFGQAGRSCFKASRVRPGVVHLSGVIVKQVACGEFHSLALTVQGEVYAFGSNTHGALGSGKKEALERAAKVETSHLRGLPIRAIAAGAQSSMALSIGGQVFCWGCNGRGRLGLGPAQDHESVVMTPSLVPNLPGMARAIAAGGQHSAVILRRGKLFLAGDNRVGQLGQRRNDVDWTSTFYELPFQDCTLRVRTVALGSAHTLILSYDGELYACGCNGEGQLGNGRASHSTAGPAPAVDVPVKISLGAQSPQEYIVVGMAACHDHTIVLALSMPSTHEKKILDRPMTSAVVRCFTGPNLGSTTSARAVSAMQFLNTIHEGGNDPFPLKGHRSFDDRGGDTTGTFGGTAERSSLATTLSSGCTSRVGQVPQHLVLSPKVPKRFGSGSTASDEGTPAEDVVLLQPVVQPGVASSVGFAGLSVAKLSTLIQAAGPAAAQMTGLPEDVKKTVQQMDVDDLRNALTIAFSTPCLLNASFCFPGLYSPRLDAGGLLNAFKELSRNGSLLEKIEMHMIQAACEGLSAWANDHDEAASLVHRDQLRGMPAVLLSPILANPQKPQPYELMSRIMRLVAWMLPEGRRELQEIIVEDCSEEEILRSLVKRVRDHCDETIRRAHQMQRLSPEIWEGLMLLQLLWGANEAIAKRLDLSLRMQPEWPDEPLRQSFTQTLSLSARGNPSPAATQLLERFAMAAPNVRAPVESTEFHLQSLAEERVPPELEFRLFIENACAGPITPSEVLSLPLYAARTDYGFEYVLPSKMRSFMANRNLVPVSYTRKVLQVENHHSQVYLQRQVAQRLAADLEVLPGHEIHIDPALLFFILKVRREHIVEDTTAALQSATPEDLRRQLKVVFEGEQGVDEGGLAREFFRLLSARIFTPECGLFDPAVAQKARMLWFDMASACESTDFWLAGVILGLVVYNNMPGLDVRFPSVIFKKIKGEQLGLEDLRQVQPDTYLSLRSLLQWSPEGGVSHMEANTLFENIFCLDFVVTFEIQGEAHDKELCEGGRDRPVNVDNREEFVRLYCEWLLVSSIERQFEPFRKGVRRVCDSPLFNALDSAELEMIVCGEQDLDFARLRQNAQYDGFAEDSPYMDAFWKLLLAFDTSQKKRFLSFVTGSDLAPVGGLQELQLVIQRNGTEPTERLPTAHTCFNLLLLPEYSSDAKLERMVITAMHNAEGFGLE